jgi:hypothetical protein
MDKSWVSHAWLLDESWHPHPAVNKAKCECRLGSQSALDRGHDQNPKMHLHTAKLKSICSSFVHAFFLREFPNKKSLNFNHSAFTRSSTNLLYILWIQKNLCLDEKLFQVQMCARQVALKLPNDPGQKGNETRPLLQQQGRGMKRSWQDQIRSSAKI